MDRYKSSKFTQKYAKTYTENAKFGLADLACLELTGQRGRLVAR
jgi:flagellar protein FlgJ